MIYAVCPNCGYAIDVFREEELKSPIREKRLKYLLSRDQVCPNCITTIGRCQRVDAQENEIPIIKADVKEEEREGIIRFAKEHGYVLVTDYTLREYRGEK
ncbi:MAG: hypothetical protein ACP5G5_06665 [Thermoplasmata archaeon]|jgi:predicted RNA-binding Zn-ribbon protein involved in translation (DUF1610 family)|nr:MAG: hypothetical protein C0180_06850 [Aciduliprofundum sp.]HEU13048.1 hypothetical protein [Euryarchaeota archaeon]